MPYTDEGKEIMLWSLAASISHVSLHSGPPPAHELSDGVYRRKQVEFAESRDGAIRTLREISFDVPAGARISHAAFWTSQYGGTMLASGRTTEQTFRGRGVYVVDIAKLDLNCEAQ